MRRTTLLSSAWLLFLCLFLFQSCLPDPAPREQAQSSSSSTAASITANGEALFKQHCITCHGANGQMGLNGAKNLTESIIDKAARIRLITNGKGVMPAFEAQLTDKQIKAVAEYSMQFNPNL